jgi:hypothetical protein
MDEMQSSRKSHHAIKSYCSGNTNYVLPQCFSVHLTSDQLVLVPKRNKPLSGNEDSVEPCQAGFLTLVTLSFLKLFRINSPVSSVLKSTLGWAHQLMAGVQEPILAHPSIKLLSQNDYSSDSKEAKSDSKKSTEEWITRGLDRVKESGPTVRGT